VESLFPQLGDEADPPILPSGSPLRWPVVRRLNSTLERLSPQRRILYKLSATVLPIGTQTFGWQIGTR